MIIHETIIIGAGISGLACARRLHEKGKTFVVISENIGGRILASDDAKHNYGAFLILPDFHHVKQYATLTQRIKISKLRLYHNNRPSSIFNQKLLRYVPEFIRLLWLHRTFRKHHNVFRKRCEIVSQARALQEDRYLFNLFQKKASTFIQEQKIAGLVNEYITPFLHAICAPSLYNYSAFLFMQWVTICLGPTYEFIFLQEKITNGFKHNILIDTVKNIIKSNDHYLITTLKTSYHARNLVVATPPHVSQELLHLKTMNTPINAHILHVQGKLREQYERAPFHLFSTDSSMRGISLRRDGTVLLVTSDPVPDLHEYFYHYTIRVHTFWNPAFHIEGQILWECEYDKNLYLIGDHNICSLEDAYITGVYAANRIVSGG